MPDPDDTLNGPEIVRHAGALCRLALDDPRFGGALLRAAVILRVNLAVRQDDPAAALDSLIEEDRDNLRSAFAEIMEMQCHGRA